MSILKPKAPPEKRRKRRPEEARSEALVAARQLLLDGGPNAVTLSNVGKAVGMTHANVIHHFGSAAALQSALMGAMVLDLTDALADAVAHVESDEAAPRQLVDIVFDAFESGGAGLLAAWIALSQELSHLEPVREAVTGLVDAIIERLGGEQPGRRAMITSAVLLIALTAFGDSVIGGPLREMLGREEDATRKITAQLLPNFF